MAYAPDPHRLERVDLVLHLPGYHNEHTARVTAAGRSQYTRTNLWGYEESWTAQNPVRDLSPVDTLHWLALAVWQDRPTSAWQLGRSLRGDPAWDQLELGL